MTFVFCVVVGNMKEEKKRCSTGTGSFAMHCTRTHASAAATACHDTENKHTCELQTSRKTTTRLRLSFLVFIKPSTSFLIIIN